MKTQLKNTNNSYSLNETNFKLSMHQSDVFDLFPATGSEFT